MEFTGERFVDQKQKNWSLYHQHIARYVYARRFVSGLRCLDVACGAGFGTHFLAGRSDYAVGVDLSREATAFARNRFASPHAGYVVMDCGRLGATDESADVVVSFETVEHLTDPDAFLSEVCRVLRPGGLFLASTPNRPLYAAYNQGRSNPYHHSEMDLAEFRSLLDRHFPSVTILGQGYFVHRDARALSGIVGNQVPGAPDNPAKRLLRILLRTAAPRRLREGGLLRADLWAHNWTVGNAPAARSIYMIAACLKTSGDSRPGTAPTSQV